MLTLNNIPESWQKPLGVLLVSGTVLLLAFWQSWNSMTSIWSRSDTFAHGFLVAPVSLWLLWTRKDVYKRFIPNPSYVGGLALSVCGFLWLVADLSQVLVVEQFALVGMLVCLFWSILGTQIVRNMMFPLGFLFLMVPFGEDFVPFLMEYTASFVVMMLRLTGISVYREGLHFTLTSGNWSVVEACSGIRYLIASITLGLVYAYLNYASVLKRFVFILASILVPILANGLRAYMIVMIGHLSDMKLATGVDHIIYGWLFFGLVMLLLFYIGSFWRDEEVSLSSGQVVDEPGLLMAKETLGRVTVLVVVCLLVWPMLANALHARQSIKAVIPAALLQNLPPEIEKANLGSWEPEFTGVKADERRFVEVETESVGIYMANFGDESQGGELINSQNTLVSKKDSRQWRVIRSTLAQIAWPASPVPVEEYVLNSPMQNLLVLRWYRIGDTNTANAYYAKGLQLLKRLSGNADPEIMIVIYTPTPHNDYGNARQRLEKVALACCP